MKELGIIGPVLIVINIIFSYFGFTRHGFMEKYLFEVDEVLVKKDYKRLITSGFLHLNWQHLIFNMISLAFFSGILEKQLGIPLFLLVYIASLLGGNLLALFIHRHHGDYRAVGASGAVCGIIFACIAIIPGIEISLLFVPFFVPAWVYGLLYILVTLYGIRTKKGNIGHEAHLGGAMIGMLVSICIKPSMLVQNYLPIVVVLGPSLLFLLLIIFKPGFLLFNGPLFKARKNEPRNLTLDDRYNIAKKKEEDEVDRILAKIHKRGLASLTAQEKSFLDKHSKAADNNRQKGT